MGETTHRFEVGMTCDGCKNAVARILGKLEGVSSHEEDVASKTVLVTGTVDHELVLAKLKKWGSASNKSVEYLGTV